MNIWVSVVVSGLLVSVTNASAAKDIIRVAVWQFLNWEGGGRVSKRKCKSGMEREKERRACLHAIVFFFTFAW